MAKVKVFGGINFEFDVKFNQTEDLVFEAKGINVNGKTIYVAKGDVTKINPKAFDFIIDRIEYFIKKNGGYMLDIHVTRGDIDLDLLNIIDKNQIEPLKTIINACRFKKEEDINKMLETGWFLLRRECVYYYINEYYKKLEDVYRVIKEILMNQPVGKIEMVFENTANERRLQIKGDRDYVLFSIENRPTRLFIDGDVVMEDIKPIDKESIISDIERMLTLNRRFKYEQYLEPQTNNIVFLINKIE